MERFGKLEFAIDQLSKSGTGNVETIINALPANAPLRKYWEWKKNEDNKRVLGPRAEASKPGKRTKVYLVPFGVAMGTADDRTYAYSNQRAIAASTGQFGSVNFEISASAPASAANIIRVAGFDPAKVIITKLNGSTTPASRITGKEYKKLSNGSWTIPFGKGETASNNLIGRFNTIATAVKALTGGPWGVSLIEENFQINAD